MNFKTFLLVAITVTSGYSQNADSIHQLLEADTVFNRAVLKADSITNNFQSKADSLNNAYQQQLIKIDGARNQLQQKIDSATHLKLPTDKLTKKLDSLNQQRTHTLNTLNSKVEALKKSTTEKLSSLNLPPTLQEPLTKLQSSIQEYSLPALKNSNLDFSGADFSDLNKIQLPALGEQFNFDSRFSTVTDKMGNIGELTEKAGEYTTDAQDLVKGNVDQVKNIDKTIEGKIVGMEGVDQLKKGSDLVSQSGELTDSAALINKAKEIVLNAAQDHFAGKQEVLQQAMDKLSKLKMKYSEVQSLAELPKRLPNPLKGKPFIERVIPAVSLQIQKSNYLLVDIAPFVLYRIRPRISAGAGWNYRLPFERIDKIHLEQSVYGPRLIVDVKWLKGINFRLAPELMYTTIPPFIAKSKGISDPAYREWVPSIFFGMKKEFTLYKQVKGYSEVLYNLYDKDDMSPYTDSFSMRFGFEFPMKKKKQVRN